MKNRNIIKIKIKREDTTIWYAKKIFRNRTQAIEAVISHLQKILDKGSR